MRNYASVYRNSKKVVNEAKTIDIDREHKEIVEAVRKEFGVVSFNQLSEAERINCRNMILEYWNPTSGLTEAGKTFLNESKQVLTDKSSDENIKRYFQREVRADATNYMYGILSGNTNGQSTLHLKTEIEKMIGRKLSPKDVKEWLYEVLVKHLQSKIKSTKLN